jgi:hypothetical protein
MEHDRQGCRGEELAARLNDEIERLDLSGLFAAEYMAGRDRVLLRRFDGDEGSPGEVAYPVCLPWSDRAIDDLRMFVKLRDGKR